MVLTVSQIMWCRDLTNCLTRDDGQILEAVQEADQRCFQVSFSSASLLCKILYIVIIVKYSFYESY